MKPCNLAAVLPAVLVLALSSWSCFDDSGGATAPVTEDPADPADPAPDPDAEYTIDRTLSDGGQRNTIAFDGLAFLTGTLGGQSFYPPGKVADYCGFQYLRDNDATEMGHNTDFVTIVATNVLDILTEAQRAQLIARAETQVDLINSYAYARFPLLQAFRRLADGDLPAGTTGLDLDAVKAASAEVYRIDGEISYDRAELLGGVIRALTAEQRAALDHLGTLGGVGNWDRAIDDPLRGLNLDHDVQVAVMTYASEMYSWYAGTVVSDTYFCPERQGTYFGSFYLKDWPAMGNPNYTINEQLTASAGEDFLRALDSAQAARINELVSGQRSDLLAIVETRTAIARELRKFQTQETIDRGLVMSLSEEYGELDGAIIHAYATAFAGVGSSLSAAQQSRLEQIVSAIGYTDATGAFLYSRPIPMPEIASTDALFGIAGGDTLSPASFTLASPAIGPDGLLPAEFTCDGSAATPPLAWTGAPDGTQAFAVVMHHVAPDNEIKWYWILYNIPSAVSELPQDVTGVGVLGNNGVNGEAGYEPPCSQGPGPKTYVLTLYALSAPAEIGVPPAEVSLEVFLAAIADRTLASAELPVTYSRP